MMTMLMSSMSIPRDTMSEHVFCGHYHSEHQMKFSHIHVHAAPPTQMQIDADRPYFKLKSTEPGWQVIYWGDSVKTEVHY